MVSVTSNWLKMENFDKLLNHISYQSHVTWKQSSYTLQKIFRMLWALSWRRSLSNRNQSIGLLWKGTSCVKVKGQQYLTQDETFHSLIQNITVWIGNFCKFPISEALGLRPRKIWTIRPRVHYVNYVASINLIEGMLICYDWKP